MKLLIIANILSVLPLLIIIFSIIRFVVNLLINQNYNNLFYLVGILLSTYIPQCIKKLLFDYTFNVTMRPQGAKRL